MFDQLPSNALVALDWGKEKYEPYFQNLLARELTAATVEQWLLDYTKLSKLVWEVSSRLRTATSVNTEDAESAARLGQFLDNVFPLANVYQDKLDRRLLQSGLKPPAGLAVPLRSARADVELFREKNVPLLAEEQKFNLEYEKIIGAQTVEWEGQEATLYRLRPILEETDRGRRETAWRLLSQRQLADRAALNELWGKYLNLRGQIAANAAMPDYRAYRWKSLHRFDYTPEDGANFRQAIETVIVPLAARLYAKRSARLGIAAVRPWDTAVDPQGRAPLRPYTTLEQLESVTQGIFARIDPQLGQYFQIMRDQKLLDLDNRKGKGPGGFCTYFPLAEQPFIFMNAVRMHTDVETLLHEGGHCFHAFAMRPLPYSYQYAVPMEFAEVASTTMELVAAPYLAKRNGGFYSDADTARAQITRLEKFITFWPYLAVVDGFQNWAYTHPQAATDPANCDAQWGELWDRFMVGIDYSGFEAVKVTGWQRKEHIFTDPFYYIEYGLAELGALQIWANYLRDPADAIQRYQQALALGGTVTMPELFAAAGAKFAFDAATLGELAALIEKTIIELDPA